MIEARQSQLRKPYRVHARLAEAEQMELRRVARQLHLSLSGTISLLLSEALAARRQAGESGPADPEELQLHVLVAVEQLLALMESIHPKGTGVAAEVMPQALSAARNRVAPVEAR